MAFGRLGYGGLGMTQRRFTPTPPDTTAPTLTSPFGAAAGATTANLSVSSNEGNGTLYWYVSASATPPTAANLKSGSGAVNAGNKAVTGSGAQTASATGLTASTTYYTHFLHRDAAGNDSAIATSASFTTSAASDTTAPTLTSASGTATSDTTANLAVTTDEANGTLYWFVSTSATQPSATALKAGTGAVDAGNKPVSATGAQSATADGLSPSTAYYVHFLHRDAAGNESARLTSASFTTDAAAPTISAPRLSFANVLAFPPQPHISVDQTAHEWEDDLRLQVASDSSFSTLLLDEQRPLTATGTWDVDPAIVDADTPFWRAGIERGGVTTWGETVQTGSSAPATITSPLSPSFAEGTVNATFVLTANQPIRRWHIEGRHIHLFDLDGDTIRFLEGPLDYEWRFKYDLRIRCENLAGVLTWADWSGRVTNTDEPAQATTWSSNYMYAPLVLSNGNMTITALAANDGQHRRGLSTQKRSGKRYFEARIDDLNTTNDIFIGVTNNQENIDFQDGGLPGVGTAAFSTLGQAWSGVTGANVGTNAAYQAFEGDVICVEVDPAVGKMWRRINNGAWDGDPEAGTGGLALPAGMTDYHIYLGIYRKLGGNNVVTLRTRTSQFSFAPTASFGEFV